MEDEDPAGQCTIEPPYNGLLPITLFYYNFDVGVIPRQWNEFSSKKCARMRGRRPVIAVFEHKLPDLGDKSDMPVGRRRVELRSEERDWFHARKSGHAARANSLKDAIPKAEAFQMPELPEVNRATNLINRIAKGRIIERVETVDDPIVFTGTTHEEFVRLPVRSNLPILLAQSIYRRLKN